MTKDNHLLRIYGRGFRDELDQKTTEIKGELLNRAYNLGRLHAIVGDDCRSVDCLSDEQILKQIKQ